MIFSVVSLICLNSIYNLFYDRQGFQPTALNQTATQAGSDLRAPASVPASFANLEMNCDSAKMQDTTAAKVRLTGPLCGLTAGQETSRFLKPQVSNTTNKFAATVFTDLAAAKYSTDYIPLNPGLNQIRVEFLFQGGQTVSQDINITRN